MAELRKYTVQEAADLLGYTPRRIQQMCQKGIIKGAVKEGRSWMIYLDAGSNESGINVLDKKPEGSGENSGIVRHVPFREHPRNDPRKIEINPDGSMNLHDCRPLKPRRLPVGITQYIKASCDYYYVDKTLFIRDLIDFGAQVSLITRPRRFGKSLNCNMLQCYFEKTNADTSVFFSDKNIWRCGREYREHQGKYPVISLSFKDAASHSSWHEALDTVKLIIREEYIRHAELLGSPLLDTEYKAFYSRLRSGSASDSEYARSIRMLSEMLRIHYEQNVIILIDEYDTPIQYGYFHGYCDEAVNFMRNLLSAALKDNNSLDRAVLMGILRVARESIFSGLNNLRVYSVVDKEFSEYFGFTPGEVRNFLEAYNREDSYDQVCAWYDGYRFGDTELFNPWSVIGFLDHGCTLMPYWVNTSPNYIIGDLLSVAPINIQKVLPSLLYGQTIYTKINTSIIYPDLSNDPYSIYSFLLVTGYLNAINTKIDNDGNCICELKIPNKEVSIAYRNEIVRKLQPSGTVSINSEISVALSRGDWSGVQKALSDYLINSAGYYDTAKESFYHGLVLGLCAMFTGTHRIRSNHESGYRRFDIGLEPFNKSDPGIIVKLKAAGDLLNLEQKSKEALSQIRELEYFRNLKQAGVQEIVSIGGAFSGKGIEISTEIL